MVAKAAAVGRSKQKAQELGDKYVCLGCEKQVDPAEEQYRRGLCEACYSEVDRLKNKGLINFDELVESGLMLTGKRGGRPRNSDRRPSAFAAFLRQKQSGSLTSLTAAAEITAGLDKDGNPKPPPKPRKKKGGK